MPNVLLIHWDSNGLDDRAERLERAGFDVAVCSKDGSAAFRAVGAAAPHAVVIDLSRQPSHGKRLAIALKEKQTTGHIPIVFVDGSDEAIDALRQALPDSPFVTWRSVGTAVKKAIAATEVRRQTAPDAADLGVGSSPRLRASHRARGA